MGIFLDVIPGEAEGRDPESSEFQRPWIPDNGFAVSGMTSRAKATVA
jgi:hypothetical protein